jgi:hypothetical protein
METIKRLALIALLLATLSGCAYGTYNTYGGGSGPGPGEPRSNYLSNCPMTDPNDCYTWFYGQ